MIAAAALWSALVAGPIALPDAATSLCAAVPDDPEASRALAATMQAKARKLRESRDLPGAAAALRIAVAISPREAPLWHELAQLELQLGQPAAAEAAWRQATAGQADYMPARLAFAEWLAQRAQGSDLDRAAELLARAQREPGVACLAARIAALRGSCDDADRALADCLRNPPRRPIKLPLAELHVSRGRCRFARGEYDSAEAAWQQAQVAGAEVAALIAQLGDARRKVAVEAQPETRKAMEAASELARAALARLDRGQEPPDRGLERAVVTAPAVGVGHLALGEIALWQRKTERAEVHLLRALALPLTDLDRARALRTLGRLCATSLPVPRWAEAAAYWAAMAPLADVPRADQLLWLEALRRTGQLRAAHRLVTRMLAQAGTGGDAPSADIERELRAHKLAIEAVGGGSAADDWSVVDAPSHAGPRARARALARADRLVEAIAIVQSALRSEEQSADLWRDLAHYQRALGDAPAARVSLRRSLELNDAQGEAHWTLARWLTEAGEELIARHHVLRAEALGIAAAVPTAVRFDFDEHLCRNWLVRLWDRETPTALMARLDRLQARNAAVADAPDRSAQLLALRSAIADELQLALAVRVVVAVLALMAIALWALRRWGGATLRSLVTEHPDTGPEVQRIVAAVRHEVIKHNTLRLGTAAEALQAGDRDGALRCLLALSGEGDSPRDKLADYAAQLDRIGRARGVRLNLRRRDPAFAPLFAGFAILGELARALRSRGHWQATRRRRAVRRLRVALRLLNANAYNATAALLDAMRLTRVDGDLLRAACRQVFAEPAIADRAVASPAVDVQTADVWVAVPRSALNEVVVNLVRNAVQVTAETAAVPIALVLAAEIAPVTALESVVISVRDGGPALAVDTVQHPQAEHGLGLVHALVERYGGALDVDNAPTPWTKAVSVRLPRAYPATLEPMA